MHEMQTAVTDVPVVCVSLSLTCALQKMAQWIEILSGVKTTYEPSVATVTTYNGSACVCDGKGLVSVYLRHSASAAGFLGTCPYHVAASTSYASRQCSL